MSTDNVFFPVEEVILVPHSGHRVIMGVGGGCTKHRTLTESHDKFSLIKHLKGTFLSSVAQEEFPKA